MRVYVVQDGSHHHHGMPSPHGHDMHTHPYGDGVRADTNGRYAPRFSTSVMDSRAASSDANTSSALPTVFSMLYACVCVVSAVCVCVAEDDIGMGES